MPPCVVHACLPRLAAEVDVGPRRSSHAALLHDPQGLGGWVRVPQHGLEYHFDATRVMFSSGNTTEKARMSRLACEGETIVDLYAGIGYFTVPLLVNAKAAFVHACEWNEPSLEALQRNLQANGVDSSRYLIHPGDNQLARAAVAGTADRVLLGLLPSSELAWPLAVEALRPTKGGWLHVHANVHESERKEWVERLLTTLTGYAASLPGKEYRVQWQFTLEHLEIVKSYAPRVHHVVADVRCCKL